MLRSISWALCLYLFVPVLSEIQVAGAAEVPLPPGVNVSAKADNTTPAIGDQVKIQVLAENGSDQDVDISLLVDLPKGWKTGAQVAGTSQGQFDPASGEWAVKIEAKTTATLDVVITTTDDVPHAVVVRNWSDPPPAPDAIVRPSVITSVVFTSKCGSKCCKTGTSEECGKIPCCNQKDACIRYTVSVRQRIDNSYTADGVTSFIAIFNAAAARGVENATVRAFNATKACPECKDCPEEKPCGKCGKCPEFPCGWQVTIINNQKIVRLGRMAFDVETGKQVLPDGSPNPNFQFELRRHPKTKKTYIEWVRWLDANMTPQTLPASMPSTSFDIETGKQINPADSKPFSPGTATHELILTEELWFAKKL